MKVNQTSFMVVCKRFNVGCDSVGRFRLAGKKLTVIYSLTKILIFHVILLSARCRF